MAIYEKWKSFKLKSVSRKISPDEIGDNQTLITLQYFTLRYFNYQYYRNAVSYIQYFTRDIFCDCAV